MNQSNNDEPAFPCQWIDVLPTTGEQVVREQYHGMTIRDYFAAKAMQGELACQSETLGYYPDNKLHTVADRAYDIADAMIDRRKATASPAPAHVPVPDETHRTMITCPICGNKRCPHASDHAFACTNSNEPGQIGIYF